MINKDKIFNLFSTTPEVKKEEKRISIEEFIESPYAKIGMFTKLILNHFVFQEKLKKFLKTEEPAYNVENTEVAANYTVFNKAWGYIREINIDLDSNPPSLNVDNMGEISWATRFEHELKTIKLIK